MNEIVDISLINLIAGYLLILLPLAGLWYFKTGLMKDSLIALVRMTIQLSLVALYLEYLFKLNDPYINSLWVLAMIGVGVFTTAKRGGLNIRFFILPLFIASITSILIIDSFFLGLIIHLDNVFDARYFIPITGMILGNAMGHNIVGTNAYFESLVKNQDLYYFLLTNSNSRKTALATFIGSALRKGLNPMIANMAVIGLISLPGMMTGQILGGSSPVTAIKYQIMIMIAIFAGCSINLILTIALSNRFAFDPYGCIRKEILR